MLILVTRPQPQAQQWVEALQALGEQARALPLIDIGAPHHPEAVEQAWRDLPGIRLVMFVSPNAALWFARLRPTNTPWPAGTLGAAPGPGTAEVLSQALQAAGLSSSQLITPTHDSAQFDSEHLWPLLAPMPWQGAKVLIISGGDQQEARGRAWLSEQLASRGATVRPVLTYHRQAAQWSPPQQALARQAHQAPSRHLWLLSSSEAVDHLLAHQGTPAPGALALATHPRVADKALAAGFSKVLMCKPTPEAVALARRSLNSGPATGN